MQGSNSSLESSNQGGLLHPLHAPLFRDSRTPLSSNCSYWERSSLKFQLLKYVLWSMKFIFYASYQYSMVLLLIEFDCTNSVLMLEINFRPLIRFLKWVHLTPKVDLILSNLLKSLNFGIGVI